MADMRWKTKEELEAEDKQKQIKASTPTIEEQVEAQAKALEDIVMMMMGGDNKK